MCAAPHMWQRLGKAVRRRGVGSSCRSTLAPRCPPLPLGCRQLRGAGMLRAGPAADQFAATLGKWWSRAGPPAAAATAYAID